MLVVAVDGPDAPLPYDYSKQTIPEDQVKSLGETGELQPNASKSIALTLAPGNYLLLCNVPGHYAAGMVLPFAVAAIGASILILRRRWAQSPAPLTAEEETQIRALRGEDGV